MIRWALLASLLFCAPVQAQSWVTEPLGIVPRHWHTQVSHGAITGVAASVGAIVDGRRGAKIGSSAGVVFYSVREVVAHRDYHEWYNSGKLTEQELRKAMWDSKLDVAWPVFITTVVWTWGDRDKLWPLYVCGVGLLVALTVTTDPGGMYNGMY